MLQHIQVGPFDILTVMFQVLDQDKVKNPNRYELSCFGSHVGKGRRSYQNRFVDIKLKSFLTDHFAIRDSRFLESRT